MPEKCLAVFGPGLLGASVALAARHHDAAGEIRVWGRREEAMTRARELNLADVCTTEVQEALEGASLAVLATPIEAMPGLAEVIATCNRADDLLVTDVGSVKKCVIEQTGQIFKSHGIDFVGSHPMAGGEQQGMDQARPDLFQKAACIITSDEVGPASLERIEQFWTPMGCRTSIMTAARHDELVARISHLPHVVASALVRSALLSDPDSSSFAGGGLRDSTRIASGDVDLWTGILAANREALLAPVREMHREVGDLLAILEEFDEEKLRDFLQSAKVLRDQFRR